MFAAILTSILANPVQAAGWVIVIGLLLQVLLMIVSGVRRAHYEKTRGELERERLALEIRVARKRIQTVEQAKSAWNGIRKFKVARKVAECADTFSFYLRPHDGKPLPPFKPGQYLTFQLNIPSVTKPVIRCYSLSDCARSDYYRVTIKRCPPPPDTPHPPGVGSSFFCDAVKESDILDVKAPNGHFFLDLEKERPVVLISGGVGITPMVAMANALYEAKAGREVWFFFGARNRGEHMLKQEMDELATKYKSLRLHVCYSRPSGNDVQGKDYHHEGRVTVDLMKKLLPSNNYDFFLCGPGAFMESITDDLRAWGVPDEWVHFEAFGPASVKRAASPAVKASLTQAPFIGMEVTFAKSGKKVWWDQAFSSLLELAEAKGVKIDAGCRAGNCGSCLVAIKSGNVDYLGGHGADAEAGSCLACICKPKGNVVLDA